MTDKQQIALDELDHLYQKELAEVERLTKNLESKQANMEHLAAAMRLLKERAASEQEVISGSFAKATVIHPTRIARDIAIRISDTPPIPPERLHGLSQSRAMIVIAKHYGGYLRTKDLTKTLVGNGLMRLTKNSQSIASRLIRDSERFDRITDGFYRLKTIEPQAHQDAGTAAESQRVLQ